MNKMIVSLLLGACLMHTTTLQAKQSVALAVELAVSPMADSKTLQVRATISDAVTHEVFAAPEIIVARGEEASITTTLPTGAEVTLSVTTSTSKQELRYEVQFLKRGRTLAVQKATVRIDG